MIERVTDGGLLKLVDADYGMCLAGGNAVFVGKITNDADGIPQPGFWIRNGKRWDPEPDEKIRPLPGQTKHIFDYD